MTDVRLKTSAFEFDGKTFVLRCNMNVLADVQEACGGDLEAALESRATLKTCMEFLAAMLNDYADEMGWPERYTSRQVGRKLSANQISGLKGAVFPLVTSSLMGDGTPGGGEDTETKNGEATQSE